MRALRERLDALDRAIEEIEGAFGELGEQISMESAMEPVIPLGVPHGYPPGALANNVTVAPWEVFWILGQLRDAYRDRVLGPAEALAAEATHG
jgi:hypothetical protein